MTAATQSPVIHAQLVTEVQTTLNDTARKLKALGMDVNNQNTSAALLRLVDRVRRAALIADTVIADLQNEARRADLENDAPLPIDPSSSASGPLLFATMLPTPTAVTGATTNPIPIPPFLQDQQPTQPA